MSYLPEYQDSGLESLAEPEIVLEEGVGELGEFNFAQLNRYRKQIKNLRRLANNRLRALRSTQSRLRRCQQQLRQLRQQISRERQRSRSLQNRINQLNQQLRGQRIQSPIPQQPSPPPLPPAPPSGYGGQNAPLYQPVHTQTGGYGGFQQDGQFDTLPEWLIESGMISS